MISVLANATYRRLYAAQVVSLLGTGLATVALALLADDIAGPAAGQVLGTALAVKMVAYVAMAPLATAAVARLPRRAVLVGADVLRALVVLALPVVDQVWQLYLLVLVLQAASATFTPTFQAVIPDVLPDEEDYTHALSLSRLAYDGEAVVSPLLAASLLLVVPADALFVGTAIGFVGSALLVLSIALPKPGVTGTGVSAPRATGSEPEAGVAAGVDPTGDDHPVAAPTPEAAPAPEPSFGARARRGVALFWHTPALRPLISVNVAIASAGAFVLIQTVVIVRTELERSQSLVAILMGVMGVGSVAVAVVLPRLLHRVPERTVVLGGATLAAGAVVLAPLAIAAGGTAAVVGLGLLWALVGAGWSAAETPVGRIIRRHVDGPDLPAVFAANFSLVHAAWLITYPVAGWAGTANLTATAVGLGVAGLLATVLAARLWPAAAQAPVRAESR